MNERRGDAPRTETRATAGSLPRLVSSVVANSPNVCTLRQAGFGGESPARIDARTLNASRMPYSVPRTLSLR
ncbi:hypothetical protein C8Q73DRAFT_406872 [Cubamyces lactineus]|nr:hypothetical protein C8Q73DRAFT_406872 [Cubamyces lactineus]